MVNKYATTRQWPNGLGYTPMSLEYAELQDAQDRLTDCGRIRVDHLSPADYETWNKRQSQMDSMQMSGEHIGKSVRY
jgi:hypothetical protein